MQPRTAEEFFSKSQKFQDTWNRVSHVISRMRTDGLSLSQAAREYAIDRRTVLTLGGSALRRSASGRYVAKASNQRLRILIVPTTNGLNEVAVRDSRQASRLAEYWDAVQRYLQKGDDSALSKFRGVQIRTASGESIPLLTDQVELDRLGNAGVLSFESLYARTA